MSKKDTGVIRWVIEFDKGRYAMEHEVTDNLQKATSFSSPLEAFLEIEYKERIVPVRVTRKMMDVVELVGA